MYRLEAREELHSPSRILVNCQQRRCDIRPLPTRGLSILVAAETYIVARRRIMHSRVPRANVRSVSGARRACGQLECMRVSNAMTAVGAATNQARTI